MEHICLDFLRNLLQYPWEDFPFVVQAAKISCHYMSDESRQQRVPDYGLFISDSQYIGKRP